MPVLLGNYLRFALLGFLLCGRLHKDYLCCGIAARTAPSWNAWLGCWLLSSLRNDIQQRCADSVSRCRETLRLRHAGVPDARH